MFETTYAFLWVFVALLGLFAIGLLAEVRELGATTVPPTRLPAGARAPAFAALDAWTAEVRDSSTILQRPDYILLFVSPQCSTCRALLEDLRSVAAMAVVILCRGSADTCAKHAEGLRGTCPILADPDGAIAEQYGVVGNPTAVIVINRQIRAYGEPKNARALGDLWDAVRDYVRAAGETG